MNAKEDTTHTIQPYSQFENQLRAGLMSLGIIPKDIKSYVDYMDLPTFAAPVELYKVEALFPGATLLATFGESVVEEGLFFSDMELQQEGKETLFLSDYLVDRKDRRRELLRFTKQQQRVEAGIAGMVGVIIDVLNHELLPVLQGKAWVTAPFDWGGYK